MNITLKGFGISPEWRFYFTKNPGKGFFIAPFLNLMSADLTIEANMPTLFGIKATGEEKGIKLYGIGVIAGWKWIPNESFTMELHGGFCFNRLITPSEIDVSAGILSVPLKVQSIDVSKMLPNFSFTLGYSF